MRKRIAALCLSAALMLPMVPQALAADVNAMTDVSGHWALDSISWVMGEELFNGTSDTTFTPDGTMTRAMFVTVLGRLAGIQKEDYQQEDMAGLFTDVPANEYYTPYVNWAVRYGITQGTGDRMFSPDEPVTRQQMATFMVRYASILNYELLSINENVVDGFQDAAAIDDYAAASVETMRQTGLLNGRAQGDGTYVFDPKNSATRAECAVLLRRMASAMYPYEGRELVDPQNVTVTAQATQLKVGESTVVSGTVAPENASNQTITWVSSNPGVATVNLSGKVTAVAPGTAEIRGYTWNGVVGSVTVTCTQSSGVSDSSESYADKCNRVFGQVTSDYKHFYSTVDEAQSHMVNITVKVWDFADSTHTTKVTRTKTLLVHENMADTITAIFDEIYNGSEQFPIKEVGCFRGEYGSEHMLGLAIDINSNENYECTNDGVATAGSYWKPGEDPYSIPRDGDVVNAFRKYGFGWGGDWRSKKDYMHFSYFST